MNTRTAHGALEHLGIRDGVAQSLVWRSLSLTQFRHALYGIGKVHLQPIGQLVGNLLAQVVDYGQRHFLHTCYILQGIFRCHRTVGYDMCHLIVSVFVFHPFEHLTTSVIIEVGINIRQ